MLSDFAKKQIERMETEYEKVEEKRSLFHVDLQGFRLSMIS